jgi:hypothetical protein
MAAAKYGNSAGGWSVTGRGPDGRDEEFGLVRGQPIQGTPG